MVLDAGVMISRDHDRDALRRAVAVGDVERLRRGAYRKRTDDGGRRARYVDTVRAVDRQLAAPHVFGMGTAAVVWGAPVWRLPAKVHLFAASSASSRSAKDVARHTPPVPASDVVDVDGLPVTSLARTVADCALTMPALDALVIADWARARPDVDLAEALDRVRSRRRPNGRARAEMVLALSREGVRSPRETWLRYLVLAAGLPMPVVEAPIPTRLGTFHCDLGWPEHGVYAEYDGLVKYRDDGVRAGHDAMREIVEEKRRADAIREAGANPVRVMAADGWRDIVARLSARFPQDLQPFRPDRRLPLPPPAPSW